MWTKVVSFEISIDFQFTNLTLCLSDGPGKLSPLTCTPPPTRGSTNGGASGFIGSAATAAAATTAAATGGSTAPAGVAPADGTSAALAEY